MFINSKYTSSNFLNFKYCFKTTSLSSILFNYDPVQQMWLFSPLKNKFSLEDSCPKLYCMNISNQLNCPFGNYYGLNIPSSFKQTQKNSGYQKIMFFDWKTHQKKVHLKNQLKVSPCNIKEIAYLVKKIKDIAISPLFGFPKTRVPYSMLLKFKL